MTQLSRNMNKIIEFPKIKHRMITQYSTGLANICHIDVYTLYRDDIPYHLQIYMTQWFTFLLCWQMFTEYQLYLELVDWETDIVEVFNRGTEKNFKSALILNFSNWLLRLLDELRLKNVLSSNNHSAVGCLYFSQNMVWTDCGVCILTVLFTCYSSCRQLS